MTLTCQLWLEQEPLVIVSCAIKCYLSDRRSGIDAAGYVQGPLKWAIVAAASLSALLEVIDTSIVNVALNDMQASLGATVSEIGWVVSGYAIANVILIPLSAWLGDRFGTKNYFIFSLIGFTLSSALCGFSVNLPMIIIARILQGLCGGGLLAKAQAILFTTFPPAEQGMAQAVFGLGVIVGPAIGPTLGGYLVDGLGWRWIFFVNLPVGIMAVLISWFSLPRDREHSSSQTGVVDWWGIGFLIVAVGSLQTFLEEGQQDDWFDSSFITTLAIASAIGFVLFIWRELSRCRVQGIAASIASRGQCFVRHFGHGTVWSHLCHPHFRSRRVELYRNANRVADGS